MSLNNVGSKPVNPHLHAGIEKCYTFSRKALLCAFFVSGIALAIAKSCRGLDVPVTFIVVFLLRAITHTAAKASISALFLAFAVVDEKLERLDASKFFIVLKLPVL